MRSETTGRVRLGAAIALLALLVAGVCARSAPAAASDASTKAGIVRILTRNGVAGSRTGVYVWDIDTGQQVYGRNSATPLAPASNLKLLTSATALLDWGPDHRFITGLYGPAVRRRTAPSTATSTSEATATRASRRCSISAR